MGQIHDTVLAVGGARGGNGRNGSMVWEDDQVGENGSTKGGGEGTKVLRWVGLQKEGMSLCTRPKTHKQNFGGNFPKHNTTTTNTQGGPIGKRGSGRGRREAPRISEGKGNRGGPRSEHNWGIIGTEAPRGPQSDTARRAEGTREQKKSREHTQKPKWKWGARRSRELGGPLLVAK